VRPAPPTRFILTPTASTEQEWKFHWLTTWDEVWDPALVAQWQGWMEASRTAHVFFHPALVRAWWETYRELRRIEPRFLIAEGGDGELVFYPLVLDRCGWKDGWVRILRPVGSNEYDYHDPICVVGDRGDPLRRFWRSLDSDSVQRATNCDLLWIPRVRGESACDAVPFRPAEKAPYIALGEFESYEDFFSGLSRNARRDVRRKQRRLGSTGAVTLRILGEDSAELCRALDDFLAAHAGRWPHAFRAAGFIDRLVRGGQRAGLVAFSLLDVGGRPVSWRLDFTHKQEEYYEYMMAYAPEMAHCSPGTVHRAKLVEWSFAQGFKRFHLLRGTEAHKSHWTQECIELFELKRESSAIGSAVRRTAGRCLRGAARLLRRR